MTDETSARIFDTQDNIRADAWPLEEYRYIGGSDVRRMDGYEKATGQAVYTLDMSVPGMLHARYLTSPYPHAAIKSMDTAKAENLQGVRAILRYDDPDLPKTVDLGGHGPSAEPPVPRIAYFEGQEIGAMVAADSVAIAEEAVRLIEVEWEVLPFVLDLHKALEPDAPLAKPEPFADGNVTYDELREWGDVAQGLAEADVILECSYRQHLNTWVGPERPCGIFRWNGDSPEVWLKHQRPHVCKRLIASWFDLPMSKVHMHIPRQGAIFGGWTQLARNMFGNYCAGVLSRRTGRPVKWTMDRRGDFCGGNQDEGAVTFKIGARRDGTILAVDGDALLVNQELPYFGFMLHLLENTRIPHLRGRMRNVWVNKVPTLPVRCEQKANTDSLNFVCNKVAAALGLDPVAVALLNDGSEGHDMVWLEQKKADLGFARRDSLRECVERGKAAIDWGAKWHPPGTRSLGDHKMHGLGFAWGHEWDDSAGSAEIAIRVERVDGSITILGCRADVGVAQETALCQIAADELGVRLENVSYRPYEDAGFFPMTPDSSTSMSTNSYAVRNAARRLKRNILEAAASPRAVTQRGSFPPVFPVLAPEDLDISDGVIFEKADPSNRISLAGFVGPSGVEGPMTITEFGVLGLGRHEFSEPLFAHGWQVQVGAYAGARARLCRQAHFIEIAVDTRTGKIDVLKVVNVNDVGKVINWASCEGQQYGGTYMAMGRALTEELVNDPITGVALNADMLNYKIPTILDLGPIETLLVETGMGYGPYGTVGIGEDVATVAPAVLGPAVFNAIGKWVDEYPITPARVIQALAEG